MAAKAAQTGPITLTRGGRALMLRPPGSPFPRRLVARSRGGSCQAGAPTLPRIARHELLEALRTARLIAGALALGARLPEAIGELLEDCTDPARLALWGAVYRAALRWRGRQ